MRHRGESTKFFGPEVRLSSGLWGGEEEPDGLPHAAAPAGVCDPIRTTVFWPGC